MTSLAARLRAASATTPGRYRVWSVAVAFVLVMAGLVAGAAADALRSATERIRHNSGPVLVATQQLVSSLAEADAAATAAFLSGADEDPEQRRLYEQALARASAQIEDVSSLIGDDPATHAALTDISVQVIRYAGLVEAARATSRAGAAGAESYLVDALNLLATTVAEDAGNLTQATQQRFARDEGGRDAGVVVAVAVGAVALAALVAAQAFVARQSRRLLNPLLVAATLAVAVATGWLALANIRSGNDLEDARRRGYDSIALTAEVQTTAYRARAEQTVAVITGDQARRENAERGEDALLSAAVTAQQVENVRLGAPLPQSGLLARAAAAADTARERAAVAEMLVRWQRYRDTVAQLRTATDAGRRRSIAVGPGSSTFNGFNFSVESVLGDNRAQFLGGLDDAARRLRGVTLVALLVPLAAGAMALGGFQLRINEYR